MGTETPGHKGAWQDTNKSRKVKYLSQVKPKQPNRYRDDNNKHWCIGVFQRRECKLDHVPQGG